MPPSTPSLSSLFFTRDVMRAVLGSVHGDVIDFGAGMSRYKKWIMEKATSYTAMDIESFPGIDIVGDAMHPPVGDNSYDTVLSTHVMEHVREPWVMAEQIKRVLKPGGTVILMAPFMYPFHADPTDYFRFSEQGMRSLFERTGMVVEECTRYGGFFGLLNEILKQKYFSPYRRPHAWWKRRLFQVIESILSRVDTWVGTGIVYLNVVIIARKPV